MRTAIVVLGSPNDNQGRLLSIALERCRQALIELKKYPNAKVLCTGGFGKHFNTTDIAHGQYAQKFLINKGVAAEKFLPIALSRFTIEDALLSLPILTDSGIERIILVTSDFHMVRAKFIFNYVMPNITFIFASAITNAPQEQLNNVMFHEEKALARDMVGIRDMTTL